MSSNNNKNNSQPNFRPFMFGGSNSCGFDGCPMPYNNRQSSGRSESVRDCMNWSNSLPSELQGNSNYSWPLGVGCGNDSQGSAYTFSMPMPAAEMTGSRAKPMMTPVAYMSIPGSGGKGDLQPISIPVQVGPAGSKMKPLQTMEPLVINAAAPMSGNGQAEPFTFKISADQYMPCTCRR